MAYIEHLACHPVRSGRADATPPAISIQPSFGWRGAQSQRFRLCRADGRLGINLLRPVKRRNPILGYECQSELEASAQQLASFSINSNAEWLSYDNARQTNTIILRNTAAIDLTLTPLIDVHASAGAAIIQVDQRAVLNTPIQLAPFSTSPVILGSGAVVGFIGDMSIIYRILKSTTLSFTASQSVGPSVVGSLFETHAVGAVLAYTINPSIFDRAVRQF